MPLIISHGGYIELVIEFKAANYFLNIDIEPTNCEPIDSIKRHGPSDAKADYPFYKESKNNET